MTLPDRQILALDNSRILAEIFINNGPKQEFFLEPNENSSNINVFGIRADEDNSIEILWSEIYNEIQIEIARQTQDLFVSSGNVVIDALHITDVFDYDSDGVSNYDERLSGTCVWFTGAQCFEDGVPDLPTSPALSQGRDPDYSFNFENSQNVIVNGEGNNGTSGWFSDYHLELLDGAFCTSMAAGPIPTQYPVLAQNISLSAGEYFVEFDVRSSRKNATMNVTMWATEGPPPLYQFVEPLSTEWQKRQLKHFVGNDFNGGFTFNSIINEFESTTYCFDNIALYKAL